MSLFVDIHPPQRRLRVGNNRMLHSTDTIKPTVNVFPQNKAIEVLNGMADDVDLSDTQTLVDAATTSLSSKVRCLLGYHISILVARTCQPR